MRLIFTMLGLGVFFLKPDCLLHGQEKLPEKMTSVMAYNRETLSLVPTWLHEESMTTACQGYGLPGIAIEYMDSYIGDEITYSDLMTYLSSFLNQPIQYLEIGVSVGKNFFQVCNFLQNGIVVGMDIERPNKSFENFFSNRRQVDFWDAFTPAAIPYDHQQWFKKYHFTSDWLKDRCSGAKKYQKKNLYLSYNYLPRNNEVYYLSGNIFDESVWERCGNSGFKFNLIFSDAFHSGDSVLYEYEMLQKYDLFNKDSFVFVWDDLNEITDGFNRIWNNLKEIYPGQLYRFVMRTRAWIGVHEKDPHYVGLIIKLQDTSFLSQLHFLDIVRRDLP